MNISGKMMMNIFVKKTSDVLPRTNGKWNASFTKLVQLFDTNQTSRFHRTCWLLERSYLSINVLHVRLLVCTEQKLSYSRSFTPLFLLERIMTSYIHTHTQVWCKKIKKSDMLTRGGNWIYFSIKTSINTPKPRDKCDMSAISIHKRPKLLSIVILFPVSFFFMLGKNNKLYMHTQFWKIRASNFIYKNFIQVDVLWQTQMETTG